MEVLLGRLPGGSLIILFSPAHSRERLEPNPIWRGSFHEVMKDQNFTRAIITTLHGLRENLPSSRLFKKGM